MNKPPHMQKRWAWIMGAITLMVALFFPPLWERFSRVEGFFWQLFLLSPSSSWFQILQTHFSDWLILLFPPCALSACTVWLWSRQMPWNPTIFRGMVVTLEAIGLALLATVVFFVAFFIIPAPGSGWGMAFAIFNTMWTSVAFVAFLPCLLIAAAILARLQRNHQIAGDGMRSRL